MKTYSILGAGLAGSLLSIYLARRGFQVRLFEKRADMRNKSVEAGRSINLALAKRGIRALEKVGVFKKLKPHLIAMRGRHLHTDDKEDFFQPYSWKDSEYIFSVSRAELNKLLLSEAEAQGVSIQFQKEAVEVDLDNKILEFRDGTKECYDCLLSADGAGSLVREEIHKKRGGQVNLEWLDHGYKELCVPPKSGGGFALAEDGLHIWPRGGFMLIALPNPGGDFTATLFLQETVFETLKTSEAIESFFSKHFSNVLDLIPDLKEQFLQNPIGRLGTIRSQHWHYKNEVLILGDAAHAIVPFHGQGMNAAFEDVFVLDQLIENNGDDFFEIFEKEQKPNANAIADMALENYITMRDSVRDPLFHLKKKIEFELERRIPEYFVPRYSMVMFHTLPYREAYERGKIQERLLNKITQDVKSEDVARLVEWLDIVKNELGLCHFDPLL